ncbi:tripartite tricarboxylate transporter substrate binding protein [Variovorax sp. NFACC27]|uniref:Bug family tripartite tricarboxylate transporter substrate binding protein n=1 Tax=unclassified Variovorax TaxID=663243 RepID=UPI000896791B|nr:Tripartite-type tricarboxylate transporter, receptor component TctC [Variovorax sp. NFACC28]SEG70153.1 Tripartite-type tricarboxylate transporter, receptor component TctC [Variovorax sp. NFACC29]SFC83172.1 Tripartite-type tricarboxylate transporter, receptor component TctC [Variovorax sp. NFACC26]SFF98057.1 Tripartite-type tricarboxylate transporter, receptor component TctC [Variovorax sp. NFACC27]
MPTISRRSLLQTSAAVVPLSLGSRWAFAQDKFPSKPITLIVPQPAGGDADVVCRSLQTKMQEVLGQPVVIDNRGGAGGNIGTALGAKAAADGYTVTFVNQGTMALNPTLYPNPGYKVENFAPVTWLTSIDLVIVAHPSVPANNLKEFLELARKEPGKYTFGTAGNGSANHLAGEMLKSMAKVDITHVPYKGGGPAIIALLGGEISTVVAFPLAALPHIKAGKLKALAVTGKKRAKALPDVPTVAESGVSGYEFVSWMGLVVPQGTPDAAIRKIHSAAAAALKDRDVAERLSAGMTEPVGAGPKEFGDLIVREGDRWSKMIKQFGMKID